MCIFFCVCLFEVLRFCLEGHTDSRGNWWENNEHMGKTEFPKVLHEWCMPRGIGAQERAKQSKCFCSRKTGQSRWPLRWDLNDAEVSDRQRSGCVLFSDVLLIHSWFSFNLSVPSVSLFLNPHSPSLFIRSAPPHTRWLFSWQIPVHGQCLAASVEYKLLAMRYHVSAAAPAVQPLATELSLFLCVNKGANLSLYCRDSVWPAGPACRFLSNWWACSKVSPHPPWPKVSCSGDLCHRPVVSIPR